MNQNKCVNTSNQDVKANESNYILELQKENKFLSQQVKLKEEELDCKIEIIGMLETELIKMYEANGEKDKGMLDIGVKLLDIYKKHVKA